MKEVELARSIAQLLQGAVIGIVAARVYPDDEAAELIGLRGKTRAREIRALPIPQVPITAGGRKIGYLGSDLLEWIEKRRAA